MKMTEQSQRLLRDGLYILAAGILSGFTMYIFVYPNEFAPTGIDGICTLIQYATGFSAGWLFIALNLPLLLVAFFVLNKGYAIKAAIFTLIQSGLVLLLENLSFYRYVATQPFLPPVFAGLLLGFRLALMLKAGSVTGGVDVIASIVNKYRPDFKFEYVLFLISTAILGGSFFLYGNLESVLFGIIFAYVSMKVVEAVRNRSREAVEVQIVTDNAERFKQDILTKFKHGATVINASGLYSGEEKQVLICVVQRRQFELFYRYLSRRPNVFATFIRVESTAGYFVRGKNQAPVPGGQHKIENSEK